MVVSVFLPESLCQSVCLWECLCLCLLLLVSLSLCLSLCLTLRYPFSLSLSHSLGCVSFGLSPPCPLSSLTTGRGLQRTAICLPPHPFPSPGLFSLTPYSRQIKCAQLLPAETGLNCTPVAMAIPDDLRGWNDALRTPCWGLRLHSLAGPGADLTQHPGRAEGVGATSPHLTVPPLPFPSPTPASPTPWDIPGSTGILHKLLGRDKAFLCHRPRPRF